MDGGEKPKRYLEVWLGFESALAWGQAIEEPDRATALMYYRAELEAGGRPTALGALAASRYLTDYLSGQRWHAIGHAIAYENATWQEVGDALGVSRQAAHRGFFATLERQERLAKASGSTDSIIQLAHLRKAVQQREVTSPETQFTHRRIAYEAITLDGVDEYWPDLDPSDRPTEAEAIGILAYWLKANPMAWTAIYDPHSFMLEIEAGDDNPLSDAISDEELTMARNDLNDRLGEIATEHQAAVADDRWQDATYLLNESSNLLNHQDQLLAEHFRRLGTSESQ